MLFEKPSIFVAIPNLGFIHARLALLLARWMVSAKYDLKYYLPENVRPHHRARNLCHREFLRSGMSHLLFIDSDTIPPVDIIDRLLSHDVPVVAAVVQAWKEGGPVPMALRWDEQKGGYSPHYGKGLEAVDVCTLACTLIKREVMESASAGVFKFADDGDWDIAGFGEDFVFCLAVQGMGYKMYADYDILCSHFGRIDFAKVNELLVKNGR